MVKHNRVFRILALGIILALLMAVIPATPALAIERITVAPSSGEIDDHVDIDGTGFDIGEQVYFYFSSDDADVGDEIDDEVEIYETVESTIVGGAGQVSGYFSVPDELDDGDEDEDVVSGDYYVYATYAGEDEILAKDDFRVIVISISIYPDEGVVNTEVEIEGSGFEEDESISIKFGGSSVDIEDGDEETDNDGDFSCTILVPPSREGDHNITVTISGDSASAEFTVNPDIDIEPNSGTPADSVTVTGTGFGSRKDVVITFGGTEVVTAETNSSGSFEATFYVPEVAAGTHEVEAEDESGNSASASFSITIDVSISPTTSVNSPGHVGLEITISGTGFIPDHEITITYASDPFEYYTTSESDGSFSHSFDAPPSEAGEHTITASDGTSSMAVTFFMESVPPVTPLPQQPYMDGKAKSLAYFDWDDVTLDTEGDTEPSLPITYELQVATDDEFATLLVDQKGLETSEYTLTEEEALESNSDEVPYYYWRVRAVDAASNASNWTGAGTFKVGFIFNFPDISGWLLYLLIGVGALLLFFIGFWLGRRGGGEYY